MKDMTDREQALLEQIETDASRLNILLAMLDLFEESDPFSYESASLNEDARRAHHLRTIRFLNGLGHLAAFYHQETERFIDAYYPQAAT